MRRALPVLIDLLFVAFVVWKVEPIVSAMMVRISYPGDIEWMEGATLVSAKRIHDGLGIYGQPSLEYIPFIYPPLYATVVGALGHIFPLGYTLARTVSTVCAAGAALLALWAARQEGARWGPAVGVAGMFVLCWEEGGTFYDLVRTDSLSMVLLGAAIVTGRHPRAWVPGLLLTLAFLAKQHAAVFGLPMLIWRWRANGRADGLRFAAWSVGPALGATIVLSAMTSGGFWTWLVTVPAVHGVVPDRLFPQAQKELWDALPWAVTPALLVPLWMRRNGYWLGITLAGLFATTMMRAHIGGFVNVLIPGFWIMAILPVVAANAVRSPWAQWVAAAAIAAQIATEKVEINRFVPTEKDREQVEALVEFVSKLDGEVLMPHAPWYLVMAGKEPSFALICLWDADRKLGVMKHAVPMFEDAMESGHWSWALVPDDRLKYGFKEQFALDRSKRVPTPGTRVGWRVRYGQLWKWKGGAAPAAEAPASEAPAAVTAP